MADFLRENLKKIGCEPSDLQCEQLNNFHKILCEWNEFMNLTGITEYNEVVIKHFVDSLAVNCVYSFKNTDRVVDIGTGAGFPGIPLKIMYPDTRFTLLDSLNKRIKFLDEVIESIRWMELKRFMEELRITQGIRIIVKHLMYAYRALSQICRHLVNTVFHM